MKHIPVSGPWITQKEIDYVTEAVTTAWYENANVYHARFERDFARYHDVRHAVALPSCTSAIHLALLALGIGPGDEVIVPDITWIASAAPITYVGATPVFADIERDSWCLSAASLNAAITHRTKAVIPVDLYGSMPDYDAIRTIADKHGIAIIEDAAEAIGSRYKNKPAGALGDIGVFSFHGSKTLTTGEGGMLITNNGQIAEKVLFQRDHGRPPGDRMFYNTQIAQKYKMSSMQAALGIAQLERLGQLVARKREIFKWYEEELRGLKGITLNYEGPDFTNSYWMTTVVIDPEYGLDKQQLMEKMMPHGIHCRPFFHPLSSLPAYAAVPGIREARERNRVSYEISPYAVNLPSALNLTPEDVQYVVKYFRQILSV
ncbi:MAG: DegT/DnrJ/EryC1/StrS family aminotransferase [Sulfuricaulis sp.]|uniref:DegT/DnrJ/EryC1/StrS family aminotransferase n=1 Tax=Sulfuricaulis sp. TaxID=2003553 RepID=UPI0025FAAA5B|nr:DegT/DnrJ/EryC1/StrS family aminotransferase [Sulfuricaulis sp.]MCR4346778.1 DegT/DnrJ/EryC1/StrS family aminotransferase [Sulfuricaulis sp.]